MVSISPITPCILGLKLLTTADVAFEGKVLISLVKMTTSNQFGILNIIDLFYPLSGCGLSILISNHEFR